MTATISRPSQSTSGPNNDSAEATVPAGPGATHAQIEMVRAPFAALRNDLQPVPVEQARRWVDHLLGFFVTPPTSRRWLLWAAPLVALVAGAAASIVSLPVGVAITGIIAVAILTWNHPPIAAYAMVAAGPIVVGFGRGQVLPILRPNEALLFGLCAILGARWLVYSRRIAFKLNRIDVVMLAVVLFGFLVPLLLQLSRLRPLSIDDVFYSLVFVRIGLLYGMVRHTIVTPGQIRTVIGFSLVAATMLGILGIMDSTNVLNTAEKLNPYFPNDNFVTDDGRGAASIGNPIGFGVYQAINALLASAMLLGGERPRRLLAIPAIVCSVGVFGSGQIGPVLAFCVGIVTLSLLTKSGRQILRWALPVLLAASIVIVPLALRRIDGLGGREVSSVKLDAIAETEGMEGGRLLFDANPGSSWSVRLYNLEKYFLPEFSEQENIWLGVSPQARVPSPRNGESFIWIESGHLWLLWTGGVPLFLTWFALIGVGLVTSRRVMRTRAGPVGIAAAACFAVLMTVNVAQTFDPHMTLRGTADILYPLLALVAVGLGAQKLKMSADSDAALPSTLVDGATS